ncbi:MAG TPA: FtsX-like permease family protein [Bacteroidales bacterium]
MFISIAWKNIWRNKVRSLIIMCAIVVGLFGGLFASALMNGMIIQRIDAAIENESANIQIHHKEFQLNKELNDTIADMATIQSVLDTAKNISAWSSRLKITAMAATAANGFGVMINGVDPEKEKQVTRIWKCISDSNGTWLNDNRKNSIVIGEKLATKLKIRLRSKIILTFQSADQSVVSSAFKVTGIYKTQNTPFDERFVFVNNADLRPIVGFTRGQTHEIAIALRDDKVNDQVTSMLRKEFPNLSIQGWKELMPELGLMADLTTQMLYIVMVIILLALCFGIINTMLMAVMERTREIGMLMAVGMNRMKVFRMIMLETVILALSGGIIGMTISGFVIHIYARIGIDLTAFAQGMENIGFNAMVYPKLETSFYFGLTILVIIAGVVSSLIPARKALRLNPVEAIRTY